MISGKIDLPYNTEIYLPEGWRGEEIESLCYSLVVDGKKIGEIKTTYLMYNGSNMAIEPLTSVLKYLHTGLGDYLLVSNHYNWFLGLEGRSLVFPDTPASVELAKLYCREILIKHYDTSNYKLKTLAP